MMTTVPRQPVKPPKRSTPDTLVLSGGGVKGVAMLGAVHKLRAAGMLTKVRTVVGTSAGALVGALVATRRDLRGALDIICREGYAPDFDFERFFKEFGLDSGSSIDRLLETLMEGESLTFGDILSQHGIKLVVCVTNLTQRRAEYLGPDTHPDMPISLAIRMSCSVPLYFAAVQHEGQWYVDGSIVDNFPCDWALDHGGGTRVLGLSTMPASTPIKTFEAFVASLLETAAGGTQVCSRAEVLNLDLPPIASLHFGASRDELVRLFNAGVQQVDAFVKKRV